MMYSDLMLCTKNCLKRFTHKVKRISQNVFGDPAILFSASDYGLLAMPHQLGMGDTADQRAHNELMHDIVLGEVAASLIARAAAAYVKVSKIDVLLKTNPDITEGEIFQELRKDGTIDFLDKLPLRIVGGVHLVMMGIYIAKGDIRAAGLTGALGVGDIVMTFQKEVDPQNPQAPGVFESMWRNGPLWFSVGLVFATSYSVGPLLAAVMSVPLGIGAYHAVRNSREMYKSALPFPPNTGKPFLWSAGATAVAAVGGVIILGAGFQPALTDAFDAIINGQQLSSVEAIAAYTAAAAVSNLLISLGYVLFEHKYGDAFKGIFSSKNRGKTLTHDDAPR